MVRTIFVLALDGLLAFLIVRGARKKLFFAYPVFYIYLLHVLLLDLFRFSVATFWPESFGDVYWHSQFVSLVIGYCVIWELYSKMLKSYEGVLQISRVIVSTTLIVLVSRFLSNALAGPIWGEAATVIDLERNMRAFQAVLLIALMGLASYYALPLGRNLGAIIYGYAFFVGTSIIHLTFRSYLGEDFHSIWMYLPPISYLLSLVIWCVGLRVYDPIPEPESVSGIEQDYEAVVARSLRWTASAMRLIGRTMRP